MTYNSVLDLKKKNPAVAIYGGGGLGICRKSEEKEAAAAAAAELQGTLLKLAALTDVTVYLPWKYPPKEKKEVPPGRPGRGSGLAVMVSAYGCRGPGSGSGVGFGVLVARWSPECSLKFTQNLSRSQRSRSRSRRRT